MSMTQRIAALLAGAAAFVACGEHPTMPVTRLAVPVLRVVGGNAQTGTAGEMLPTPLVVSLTDAHGNPVAGWAVAFQVTAGEGSVDGSGRTGSGGTAEARWTLGSRSADSQRVAVRISDSAAAYAAEVVFSATARPGPAASIAPYGDTYRRGVAGKPLPTPLAVQVTDRYGNPAEAVVEWTADAGALSPAQSATDAQGVARSVWTLGPEVGPEQKAEAAAGTALRVRFTGWGMFDSCCVQLLVPVTGDGQSGRFGATLEKPLRVRLRQSDGSPIPGTAITWSVSDGTVQPSVSFTNAAGEAEAWWTLPSDGEEFTATARAPTGPWTTFHVSATRLKEVARVPGQVLDAADGRVLWFDAAAGNTVWLRDHGTDVRILAAAGTPDEGYLYPAGALVAVRTAGFSGTLYEWRGGRTESLGPIALAPSGTRRGAAVKGSWAVWTDGTSLFRRDLAAGTSQTLAAFGRVDGFDVAENGSTVYGYGSITVVGGPASQGTVVLRPGPYSESTWTMPRTDGVHVLVWSVERWKLYRVSEVTGTYYGRLSSWNYVYYYPDPGTTYQASGGWVACVDPGSVGSGGFVIHAGQPVFPPSGEIGHMSLLAPDGSLMIYTNTRRYLVPLAGPIRYVSPLVPGRVIHASGRFYLLSGGTVYEVVP
ncbi:MAG TPA: Ig-like domain-containing protein [Longimicrobium sp.]|nr:Ig-like domain-containing protein [Longimicrobium sp.]